ncbi:MAG: glycosyltransferase family 4 protein [Alphaproteobacteria bacterium]|jgi:glycosyltransferase involved in cell wall biosynthesis|nr:glycosyltransferase family 4 protein [Alphaproteobacteria bacterium]
MKIIKVYPHNYPLHISQNASIVSASMPYISYSSFDIKIISSNTANPVKNENIIYVGDIFKESLNKDTDLSNNINSLVKYEDYLNLVISKIKEINPDLIEVELDLDLASDIAKSIGNIPVALICHLNLIKSSVIKNVKRFFKIRRISAFIFVSHYFQKRFLRYYPFYKNKTYVVHNSYKHIKEDIIFDTKKENQIIFLGRATKRKGIKEYIKGVSQFLLKNKDWKGVIVGSLEQQKEIDYLNEVIKDESVDSLIKEGRILIYKNQSNSKAFEELKKSKIAVFPTIPKKHQEGIPMVALEAGMAKCLIVSSTSGGYPEINPFKESILTEVSSKSILEKLEYFSSREEAINSLSQKQHEFIKETFLFDKLRQKFDQVRENILKNYRKTH